ncbi:hypothetical protein UY3_17948 [Chelonia mydas]|uniref:Uncharacterized protein n=1 Tax=Chelonia mydas TaxID=8469 RepID=M7AQ97_CHEMY|nr:hypothetical protein UY3_17948 [Chelonia mydas]
MSVMESMPVFTPYALRNNLRTRYDLRGMGRIKHTFVGESPGLGVRRDHPVVYLRLTNTAATLKPVIMQGTEFSRMEWKSINFMKKLIQIQTDIIFLSKCKQMDIIPKGLKLRKSERSINLLNTRITLLKQVKQPVE